MDMKKVVLLVVALVVAAGSAFAIRALLAGGVSAPPVQASLPGPLAATPDEPVGPRILVAQATLPVGTIISPEHVAFQPWPEDMVHNAYYIEDADAAADAAPADAEGEVAVRAPASIDDVVGTVVRISIGAGQPVSREAVVGPGESGFLAAALNPGMRAVTVPINNITGVAGFVFPGDRVDLLLTHNIGDERGETDEFTNANSLKVAETIARNVRVLAVDQRTNDTELAPQAGSTVTFEVPPKLVEKISVAQMIGKLHLSLRSIADQRLALDQAIANGEIEVGDDQTTAEDLAMEFAATQLPDDRGSTFTTGGEVSRFALDQEGRTRIRRMNEEARDDRPVVTVRMGKQSEKLRVEEEAEAFARSLAEGARAAGAMSSSSGAPYLPGAARENSRSAGASGSGQR